ncbi:MAG: alpha/beta hydrolase [Fimbriimonadaceae bacterium]|nr:alpha/beta hydrolase [Fimbriimonadaceae bacterium]
MQSLGLILAFAVAVGPVQERPQPERKTSITGTVKSIKGFESKVLGNARDVWVYLPPDYDKEPSRRYPVLYMHDGQNVFDGMTSYLPNMEWRADEAAEALIRTKLIEPVIIVGVSNAGMDRANEYLPTKARMGQNEAGGRADLYGKMLTDELMPLIDKTYRTKRGPANTAICGSSFGGIVTLHLGLSRPDAFGKWGVVSPSLWWDERLMIKRVNALSKKPNARVWLDMGTLEGPGAVVQARELRDAMIQKGWVLGKDLVYYEDGFAVHNEGAWAGRMDMILSYFYGRS